MTGLSKAGFGGAMGRLAVPLMSLVIAPAEAAGIMLPILCGMDAVGLRRFAGSFDWSNLRIIILLFATGGRLIWDGVSRLSTHGMLHG